MAITRNRNEENYVHNLFEEFNNSELLYKNLNKIDAKNIRFGYKNAKDPINLAFDTVENVSLKSLARDFIKESFTDAVSFITRICK